MFISFLLPELDGLSEGFSASLRTTSHILSKVSGVVVFGNQVSVIKQMGLEGLDLAVKTILFS